MNKLAQNKIKYILLRYKIESKSLSANLRLELLRRWIKNCLDSEEYEMLTALRQKRNELIRIIRIVKIGEKHPVEKILLKFKWLLRKIKRKFLSL